MAKQQTSLARKFAVLIKKKRVAEKSQKSKKIKKIKKIKKVLRKF